MINFSRLSESPLPPEARLVSEELLKRADAESPGRPIRPLSLFETCDVEDPDVTGRFSRALVKLSDRRGFEWVVDVEGLPLIR